MLDLLTIGREIAIHRRKAGLTQVALARKSGLSRSTIAALETGVMAELGFGKVVRLLAVLGLDLRVGVANAGRPTLEDLERQSQGASEEFRVGLRRMAARNRRAI